MHTQRRTFYLKCLELFDIGIMGVGFALATLVYFRSETITIAEFLAVRAKVQNFIFFSLFLVSGHIAYAAFGLYHSRRLASRAAESWNILKATAIGTVILWVAGSLCKVVILTPMFVAVFFTSTSIMLVLSRLLLRWILCQVRLHGRNLRFMLIVGSNPRAVKFARQIESHPERGYRVIGFVDDEWAGTAKFHESGNTLVTNIAGFRDYIRNHVVDEVVIDLPVKSLFQEATEIVGCCEEQGLVARYLPYVFNTKLAQSTADHFEGNLIVTLFPGPRDTLPMLAKQLIDISISLILIILLSPLFILVALLIKLSSPGPVFFVQERVGLNKRRFHLYKFRTMVHEAEKLQTELESLNEMTGPVFKISNDPRITPIGKILRKFSIDELPQLFNVLFGDMSLVGPRPLPVRDYGGFDQDWHRRRFSVRPGITCLWQVAGRNAIPFDRWMELDLEYIDNWSLWLDLNILARTIPKVLRGSGAT